MKRKSIFAVFMLLLNSVLLTAGTVVVPYSLYEGADVVCADDWSSGYVVISSDKCSYFTEGDQIIVNVKSISTGTPWPQVALNTSSWAAMVDNSTFLLTGSTAPCEVVFDVTAAMAEEIRSNGFVVKGAGFTFDKVVLNHKITTSDTQKTNPLTNIWVGNAPINWSSSPTTWHTLQAASFSKAKSGYILRFNFTDLAIGAQAHICTSNWTDMPGAAEYLPLSGVYYEFTITDAMLTELKQNGCIVTGIGYTLTSVQLIDPANVYNIVCTVPADDVKAWEEGENPKVSVSLRNLETYDVTTTVDIAVRTDKYATYYSSSIEVGVEAGAVNVVDLPLLLEPGFYHVVVLANHSTIRDFNIGYMPEDVVSVPDMQTDFDTFWNHAKEELADVAPEYSLTKIDAYSTSARNVYLVEMKSIDNGDGVPVTIRGYYAEPVAEGKYPVVITQNGYDSDDSTTPYCPNGNANPGWIELVMSNRGQLLNNREPNKADNIYGDWFQYNFGNKDKYYYRGAYMDVVRSIDFIASRGKADKGNIFMAGGSQGGAFTIAGAALDNRLNAIAPSIPFMGDFPDYFKVGAWPASRAKAKQAELGMSDEDMYAFLSYFDTKNLAARVTCPVYMAVGLQDAVCPPHTNFAPYNNLASKEKLYIVNGEYAHSTPPEWYSAYMNFFKSHLRTEVVIPAAGYASFSDTDTALDFSDTGVQAFIVTDCRDNSVTLEPVESVPASTGLVLKAEQGTYYIPAAKMPFSVSGNLLEASGNAYTTAEGDYYLGQSNVDNTVCFVRSAGGRNIPAGKAYLPSSNTGASKQTFLYLNGEVPTGVHSLPADENTTSDDEAFNMGGKRVNDGYKGLVIMRNKKIIRK